MRNRILRFTKRSFVQNVIVMVSGTAAAQFVSIALSPIITRLYGPDAYGIMGVFQSFVQIIVPIVALTYPDAIVLPKRDSDAKGLMKLSLYISAFISVFVAVVLFLSNDFLVKILNLSEIASFIYFIPIVIFLSGLMQVNEQWLIRTKQFKIAAKTSVYRAFIINGGKAGIGFFHPVSSVLIFLTAIENGIRSILISILLRNSNYYYPKESGTKTSLKSLAYTYKDFPIYRSPQAFLDRISQNIPTLLLTIFFGPAAVGFFTIGRTVLSMPSQLIGKSVGDVFYPRIAEAEKKGENLSKLILKATLSLAGVGIIPYGVIIILGPWLFSFIYGSEWYIAGQYAQWMALWTFGMFINRPSFKALPVLSAQAFQLRFAVLTLIARAGAFLVGYYLFRDALIAIAFFSVVAAVLNVTLILLTLKRSREFDRRIKRI